MHSALKVPEILCLIFKCDIFDHDLFNCALVCRLWGIWAGDVLWGTCRVPLQKVLQVLAPVTRTNMIYGFKTFPRVDIGSIKELGWRRFLALSSKITRIRVDCGVSLASVGRIKLAKRAFNGEPFGQLQTLKMEIEDRNHKAISLVAVPSLTSVYLHCMNLPEDSLAWVAQGLPGAAPNIAHLGLTLPNALKLDISRYSTLKRIEVCANAIHISLWESLAGCLLLTKVLLTRCKDVTHWAEKSHNYVYFPALRTFKIRLGSPRITSQLMLCSRMPMLERLCWDAWTGRGSQLQKDLTVPHLKVYSPKLDVDTLYASSSDVDEYEDDSSTDSDDDCW